tara:strand:- start:213 stop:848 length:636 start_codon:yes stop_codon:yes gene_type:complete
MHIHFTLTTVAVLAGCISTAPGQQPTETVGDIEFFEKSVRPLLPRRCLHATAHSPVNGRADCSSTPDPGHFVEVTEAGPSCLDIRSALAVDHPIAALIGDLKTRGLLDSTLIVFAAEFGRTLFAQGTNGRDHNPQGFSIWMAGGGIRGGTLYGATDEFGYRAVENRLTVHDLHANMLHLLGIDHTRLTRRFGGRDVRLTDVHGRIILEIMA